MNWRFRLFLAWRNIVSSKGRSIVTVILGIVSTAILVFSSALMDGSHGQMLKNAVEVYPGYISITHEKFRDEPGYEHLIFDLESVQKKIEKVPGFKATAVRFETFVLYAAGEKAVGGMLSGIEPENESKVSRLQRSLLRGEYLSRDDTNALYIGAELAKKLKVDIGDTVAFIGNGADYSFAADNLRVKGVFQSGSFEFDSTAAFVNKHYFDSVMASQNMATHIIVEPQNSDEASQLAAKLQAALKGTEMEARSWQESMESLVKAMELDSIFGYITLGIFFVVIFFVVMIYTLLVVFARVKEIGMLRAIGTRPGEILSLLLNESVLLSLTGVLIGGLIGALFAYYFNIHPIEYGEEYKEQFKQYNMVYSAMPAAFAPWTILRDMAVMFVLSIASMLYPIFRANRIKPVEAMRRV